MARISFLVCACNSDEGGREFATVFDIFLNAALGQQVFGGAAKSAGSLVRVVLLRNRRGWPVLPPPVLPIAEILKITLSPILL